MIEMQITRVASIRLARARFYIGAANDEAEMSAFVIVRVMCARIRGTARGADDYAVTLA
jgi:hypothetical protein